MNSSRETVARGAVGREPAFDVSRLAALAPDRLQPLHLGRSSSIRGMERMCYGGNVCVRQKKGA
jgi:hypothetical protein